jgi:mannitol-1-phosphate 5-dehydrogenase
MKAVLVGPGRAGCGIVAPPLHACGCELVFVGRDRAVVENLNRLRHHRVVLAQRGRRRELTIDRVRALHVADADRIACEIANADIVATAVGASELGAIAPLVAAGLTRRTRPLNVLCFENLADAGRRLRAHVAEHMTDTARLAAHGFAGALATRAVTRRVGDPHSDRPLTFVGDFPEAFLVERDGLAAPLPRLDGMKLVDDYTAAMRAKLYIFSSGHAAAAYLGNLKRHRYVHTAMRDLDVRGGVLGAMQEGRRGIAARYGDDYATHAGGLGAIAARFENAALSDPVSRVGRDPRRKLSRDDRLVGAARLALAAGATPVHLCMAAAAALCFTAPGDASAESLRAELERDGVERTVAHVTGLAYADPLVARIAAAWAHATEARAGGVRTMWEAALG